MNPTSRLVTLGFSLLFSATLFANTPLVLDPVGPDSGEAAERATGGMRVYSGRSSTAMGADAARALENTTYEIRTNNGALIDTVQNVYGERKGDRPTLVTLAPGSYRVVAYSARQGLVTVPVVIAAGRVTTVRFDQKS